MSVAVKSKREMDLTQGSILKKLTLYSIPFIFANILQILFNTADIAILGIFVGDKAVAAVGANSALSGLLVNLFVAFSIGSNIVLARYVGARDMVGARKTVGTSIIIALIAGFFLLAVGVPMSELFLIWMGCDPEILSMATVYLRIYFLGMPIMMLYNFSASILRAVGDTRRPLIFLAIGGAINVVLNIFFVTVLKMTVEGVAIATIVSQLVSATLSLIVLLKSDGYGSLKKEYFKISKEQLKEILAIGVPSALQSLAFNVSNVLIQSKVNSFGATGTAGSTAATQFDAVIYNIGFAISSSCMAFVGQNVGAKNMQRVKKTIWCSILLIMIFQFGVGVIFALLAPWLVSFIVSGEAEINYATTRLVIMSITYFMCGIMEVLGNGGVRTMGKPVISMVVSICGAAIFRSIFLEVTFYFIPEFSTIFLSYLASWTLTALIYVFIVPKVYKGLKKKLSSN